MPWLHYFEGNPLKINEVHVNCLIIRNRYIYVAGHYSLSLMLTDMQTVLWVVTGILATDRQSVCVILRLL